MTEEEWKRAVQHVEACKRAYLEIQNMPQVNVGFVLQVVIGPLLHRFYSGERTKELYDELLAVE